MKTVLDKEEANSAANDTKVTTEPVMSTETGVVATEEELEAFHIVKAILRKSVELKRIAARDVQSYFGILLDDNNRKPICRLYFNTSRKSIGIFG